MLLFNKKPIAMKLYPQSDENPNLCLQMVDPKQKQSENLCFQNTAFFH